MQLVANILKKHIVLVAVFVLPLIVMVLIGDAESFLIELKFDFFKGFEKWVMGYTGLSLFIALALALGPWGSMQIGTRGSPEFSRFEWYSMLFAAGMGSGLVYWAVAEPLIFYNTLPNKYFAATDYSATSVALSQTFFHWGFHAWALYALSALALYFVSRRLSEWSVQSNIGRVVTYSVTIIFVLAVLFGVVSSLGEGALLLASSSKGLFNIQEGQIYPYAAGFLILLAVVYIASSFSGMRQGILVLSRFNIILFFGLLVLVTFARFGLEELALLWESSLHYAVTLVDRSFYIGNNPKDVQFSRDWTLTYFMWWVAWAPFVGAFLFRISVGRTLREFLLGVTIVPTIVTMVWFGVFGTMGVEVQSELSQVAAAAEITDGPLLTGFYIQELFGSWIISFAVIVLVFTFHATSCDSASYVLSDMAQPFDDDIHKMDRVYWGLAIFTFAMFAISFDTIQNMTRSMVVVGAIPLFFLLVGGTIWFVVALLRSTDRAAFFAAQSVEDRE